MCVAYLLATPKKAQHRQSSHFAAKNGGDRGGREEVGRIEREKKKKLTHKRHGCVRRESVDPASMPLDQ